MRIRHLNKIITSLSIAGCFAVSVLPIKSFALTESGTRLLNQAAATYVDNNGIVQDVISNQVETLIRQVAGIDLVASQTKPGVPNGQVLFPHTLTNTGNGADSYELCIDNQVGAFSFSDLSVFADENEDGLPDSSTEIVDGDLDGCFDIGPLSPGETFSFVVVAETPDIAASNQSAQFDLIATSDFNLGLSAENTDEVILIDGPLIEVVKRLSEFTGFAGTGGYSVILEYRNVGTEAATDLIIADVLPTNAVDGSTGDLGLGMIYTPGTSEWQQGAAQDLLDNSIDPLIEDDDVTAQIGGGINAPANVIYCAYDVNCDATGFAANQATIQIDTVPVGAIGTIRFDFSVDDGYEDNAILSNFVTFEYRDALDTVTFGSFVSNTVNFVITEEVQDPGVVANDSDTLITNGVIDSNASGNVVGVLPSGSVAQGESAFFTNYIWNSAAGGIDTFDITIDSVNDREGNPIGIQEFPAGTSFTLLQPDGQTPLQDTNGNGIPDTGPLNSGENFDLIVRVDIPVGTFGNNSGNGWSTTIIATSITDATVTNAVTDFLATIAASSVDLTNDAAGTLGAGQGAEADPVTTITVGTQETGVFQLWVENTSTQPDSYILSFSDQNFVEGSLPAGWSIDFFEDGGAGDCTTTGNSAAGSFIVLPGFAERQLFCATVNIAEGTSSVVEQDVFFRVISSSTGAVDIKRDAVTVPEEPLLEIELDLDGQGEPGGIITYPHTIFNRGNQDLKCVNVNLSDSLAAESWTSSVFLDIDEDGEISGTDVLLTDQNLAVGEQFRIVVRIFIPTSAALSIENITTVEAQGYVDDGLVDCPGVTTLLTDSVLDTTTTTNTDMVITKRQLIDTDCDGIVDIAPSNTDPAAVFSLDTFTVLPQQCVIYRLDATNQGLEILFNATVRDIVPGFTSYLAAAEQCTVQNADPCSFIAAPADGATNGAITVESAQVLPSGMVTVFFGIKIE